MGVCEYERGEDCVTSPQDPYSLLCKECVYDPSRGEFYRGMLWFARLGPCEEWKCNHGPE